MRSCFLMMLFMACSTVAAQPVVEPVHGVFNVRDFGAVADGETDATAAFQQALDAAGEAGGGRVFVPAGIYMLRGTLDVPAAVTLAGVYEAPPRTGRDATEIDPRSRKGSILLTTAGKGEAEGTPFITLREASTITGLTVFYPEQTTDIVEYPWCVRGVGDNCTIINVLLMNPYQAVDFGTIHPAGRHFIDGLYAQPLKTGLFIDKCYDVGRVQNVHFWPFWNWDEPVKTWMLENGTAFIIGRTDWEYMNNCFTLGYKIGYHFISRQDGPGNAVLTQCGADLGPLAVKVDAVQPHAGVSFVNGQFMAGVDIAETNQGPVKFTSSGFWGIEETDTHATIRGGGHVTFTACHFEWWARSDPEAFAIVAQAGGVTVNGCEFIGDDPRKGHIRLGEDVEAAVIVANRFRSPMKIDNRSEGEVAIANNLSSRGSGMSAALDAGETDRVAAMWEKRLERSGPSDHPAGIRLASAVLLGDRHADLRDQLLQSLLEDEDAAEAVVDRARDEMALAEGGEIGRPVAVARRLDGSVEIDGDLDEAAWEAAAPIAYAGDQSGEQYEARLLWDEEALYLGVRLHEPFIDRLRAEVTERDGQVWTDDSLELFLAPGRSTHRYFQMIFNAAGVYYDGTGTPRSTSSEAWNTDAEVATDRADDAWTLEVKLDWDDLGHGPPEAGDVWGLDLRRWQHTQGRADYSSWSGAPLSGPTHHPEAFGFLRFE